MAIFNTRFLPDIIKYNSGRKVNGALYLSDQQFNMRRNRQVVTYAKNKELNFILIVIVIETLRKIFQILYIC